MAVAYQDRDQYAGVIALLGHADRNRERLRLSVEDTANLGMMWCELSDDGLLLPQQRVAVTAESRADLLAALEAGISALLAGSADLAESLRITRARDYLRAALTTAT